MGMASGSWKPCSTKSTRCQCWLVLFTLCVVVCLSVLLRGGFHPTNPLHSDIHSVQTSSVQMYRLTPTGRHVHWFEEGSGNFSQRLSAYNQHISSLRQVILSERRQRDWKQLSDKVEVVWCNKDDFMQTLQKYPQVQTVVMPWILTGQEVINRQPSHTVSETRTGRFAWSSLTDKANLLVQKYYTWIASEPLCQWIHTPGFTKARWDAVYNRTCETNTSQAFPPKSLEVLYFYGKPINPSHYWPHEGKSYPSHFYTHLPDRVLYLHIIQDGIITVFGDILSGDLKLVPYSCSQDLGSSPPDGFEHAPVWNEVFVITQYWGDAFFHKMLESLPRIAPYIEFLQTNKHIKVHVAESHGYTRTSLKFLGIGSERIISGPSRAKLVYLPQATACGFTQVQEIQMLSHLYRQQIAGWGLGLRNLVVLIQRTGLRRFMKWEEVAFLVEKLSGEFGFEYAVFPDNPSPPMEQAMQTFYQAVMVVAPHGAGLANVVYSQPGTFVIEGVCNPPHVNMCFQWTSHVLGHRYHGIPSRGGCEDYVDVEPQVLAFLMRLYLEQIKSLKVENVFT